MTVPPLLVITHALNGLLMVILPIALAVYLTRRFRLGWRLWWIGAGTFILAQIGHIPFNIGLTLLFERDLLPSPPEAWQVPFNAIVLGLSAGLWEELSRYAAFRWWAKDARSWRKAVLLGAGHSGVEAIILGALVLLTFVNMLVASNLDLAGRVPADQLELARQQLNAYWSAPWYLTLFGALERLLSIPVQITLSILVLQTFVRRQWFWVWLAVLWHAVIDAAAVYIIATSNATTRIYAIEFVIAVVAVISLGLLFILRQPEPLEPAEIPEEPIPTHQYIPTAPDEIPEKLEDTRYSD